MAVVGRLQVAKGLFHVAVYDAQVRMAKEPLQGDYI
jgi:hypothetical protein